MIPNDKDRLQITELFMAKAGNDFSRCIYGTIKRLKTEDDIDYCYSKITINQGFVCAMAGDDKELGRKLDEMDLFAVSYCK
jgi:hypothetical protein